MPETKHYDEGFKLAFGLMSYLTFVTEARGAGFHTFTECKGHMTSKVVEVTWCRLWQVEIDLLLIWHRSGA